MDLIRVPTFDEWVAAMLDLLDATILWLLTSWFGPTVLVVAVLFFIVPMIASAGGPDPLFDDQPWED